MRCVPLLLVALIGACKAGPSGPDELAYPTDFPIEMTSGSTPTISWSGGNASRLQIKDMSRRTITDDVAWSFSSGDSSVGFGSPVRYGNLPAGYRCGLFDEPCQNAKPLERGIPYLLMVFRIDGRVGVKVFIP